MNLDPSTTTLSLKHEYIQVMGRVHWQEDGVVFSYPGVMIEFNIQGESVLIDVQALEGKSRLDIYLNDRLYKQTLVNKKHALLIKLKGADKKANVKLVNRGETWHGITQLQGIAIKNGALLKPKTVYSKKLLFIGDSVTCGALMNRNPECNKGPHLSDSYHAFPMQIGRMLNAQTHIVGFGGRGVMRSWDANPSDMQAPEFFELAIPSQQFPILWDHQNYHPEVIVISLGTNDFNLGIPTQTVFEAAYVHFLQRICALHSHAQVFITEGAMLEDNHVSIHKTVARQFLKNIVKATNNKHVSYLPSVHHAGDACDPHPTRQQHDKIAKELTVYIQQEMGW